MNDTKPKTDYEKPVGAVWMRETSDGRSYLSMKITGKNGQEHNFVGFLNKFKDEGVNRPDYNLFVSKPKDGSSPKPDKKLAPVKKAETTPEAEF
jgi:hypothetical protein